MAAIAAIAVGPDYHRPDPPSADAYRDADLGSWKQAAPADTVSRGEWWKVFNDSTLNELESRSLAGNQDLRAAAARVEQARAAAGLARSAYWPAIAANGTGQRLRALDQEGNYVTGGNYAATLNLAWEIDLFGRVRRLSESARNDAAASAATFESVRLALTSDVAANYFSLLAVDREAGIVNGTVDLRHRALQLVKDRFESGAASDLDLSRAETELAITETDAAALANRRASLQTALAVLVGEAASRFVLLTAGLELSTPPVVPSGLPADLLERRPDIAAAERSLAAANARIGVAKAAFFPAISLTGGAGYNSFEVDHLFSWDHRVWSIGPSLYLPIFQGGRNRANLERSHAAYDESVATYRQAILVGFREVQDALTATKWLTEQAAAQERAVASARRSAVISEERYKSGLVNYLEVVDAQRTALQSERSAAQLAGQRYITSVALIKALGGGWSTKSATTVALK